MKDLESKQKVLEEIMSMMDEKEGEKLKGHPKLMAAKVEVAKPVALEIESDEPMSLDAAAKKSKPEADEDGEMTPEMIQKILEMYQDIK